MNKKPPFSDWSWKPDELARRALSNGVRKLNAIHKEARNDNREKVQKVWRSHHHPAPSRAR